MSESESWEGGVPLEIWSTCLQGSLKVGGFLLLGVVVLEGVREDAPASVSFDSRGLSFPGAGVKSERRQPRALEGRQKLVAVGKGQSPKARNEAP